MADDGETKDDVKIPDGEVGERIDKLFTQEEKDTSKIRHFWSLREFRMLTQSADVVVLTAMGEQLAVEAKEAPRG